MSSLQHPFHRLLSFFARQGSVRNNSQSTSATLSATTRTSDNNDANTIRFIDSLRGDLALGFNFPLSVFISLARHLIFRNEPGLLSLSIHIPSVKLDRKLLGGPGAYNDVQPDKRYSLSQLDKLIRNAGGSVKDRFDAIGIYTMAAQRKDGKISGKDVRDFQQGAVLDNIAQRRRGRDDVLPFWRGGPLS